MAAVVAGSSVPGLAMDIARILDMEFVGVAMARFPDGELHVKIDNSRLPRKVYYVQTMAPHPNERLTELLLTSDLLKDLGCKEIVAIIPYLGYTRQDYRRIRGEAVSVGTLFKLFEGVGISEIVSVDIHLHRLGLDDLKEMTEIRINEVSAIPDLARNCSLQDVVVIAPDSEAKRWAKSAAEVLKTDYGVMEKLRITPTEVEVSFGKIDVSGRNILIVDDIVSTGGTMIETAQLLKTRGAGEISAAFTHAVLSSTECVANLFNAGITELISSNTVQNEFASVNVAGLLASALT
jgi:ribose-phosphate pyrophosphokinase